MFSLSVLFPKFLSLAVADSFVFAADFETLLAPGSNGIDSRYARHAHNYFGPGAYFACSPHYSARFSRKLTSPAGTTRYEVLLCHVIVGVCRDFGQVKQTSLVRLEEAYDSVRGGPFDGSNSQMYVVYEDFRAYPAYRVVYNSTT